MTEFVLRIIAVADEYSWLVVAAAGLALLLFLVPFLGHLADGELVRARDDEKEARARRKEFMERLADAALRVAKQLDAWDPQAGFASLESAAAESIAPELLQIAAQQRYCQNCPGLESCKADANGPKHYIVRRVSISILDSGRARATLTHGACDLRLQRDRVERAVNPGKDRTR